MEDAVKIWEAENKDGEITITPVIENTAMRYGLIPLEVSLERENNREFLRIFIYSADHNAHYHNGIYVP